MLCGRHAVELLAVVRPEAPEAEPEIAAVEPEAEPVAAPIIEQRAAAPAPAASAPRPTRHELQIREYAAQLEREGYSHEAALARATDALRPCDHKKDAAAPTRGELTVSRAFLKGVLLEQASAHRGDAE